MQVQLVRATEIVKGGSCESQLVTENKIVGSLKVQIYEVGCNTQNGQEL